MKLRNRTTKLLAARLLLLPSTPKNAQQNNPQRNNKNWAAYKIEISRTGFWKPKNRDSQCEDK
jgi:hypothetical protein